MLYYLLTHLIEDFGALNVVRYISFRAMIALLTALIISFSCSPWFIKKLQKKQLKQIVRDDGPQSHFSKQGTPTMGGGLILLATCIPTLLWMNWETHYLWCSLAIFAGYGFLGFLDDYKKITKRNTRGVTARQKLFFQITLALIVSAVHFFITDKKGLVGIPFVKDLSIDLGYFYILFSTLVIVSTSNSVNLTDGLDGLAIGPIMTSTFCFALLAYISGHSKIAEYLHYPYVPDSGELTIFAAALIGASLGFLWYNTYPAQVFMGDIGSLSLGGALGALAVFSKHELILVIIGGIFVLEAVSVITQVASFKLTGKRVFRMAPIHHHFELKGWPEPKVIVRFWIISIILAIIGMLSIKIR